MANPWDNDPIVEEKATASPQPWDNDPIMDEGGNNPLPFANRAIAGALGAPVDLVTAGLNLIPGVDIQQPVGGSESIASGFRAVGAETAGMDEQPKTPIEYIGTGVGEAASFMLPLGKASQLASKGTGLVGRVAKTIYNGIIKHPYLTMISEATGGAGAGTGRYLGEEVYPDHPLSPMMEMAGGMAGGGAPAVTAYAPGRVAARATKGVLKKASLPFTEQGSKYRAGEFLKKQVVSPDEAIKKATTETIGELPPAVASGEKRLLALYKQFREADVTTDNEAIQKLGHSIYELEQELRGLGYGTTEQLREITAKRVASIDMKMQTKILDATEIAQQKIDALPAARRQSQESMIVRDEIERVMKADKGKVDELWGQVPKDIEVDYSGSKQAYMDMAVDIPRAQRDDIPAVLKSSFLGKKNVKYPVNVKEMQGLRSKLLEVQRVARKNGEWNKARIAGDVADAILDDLDAGMADNSLRVAIDATRAYKQRFETGVVGKILGYSKDGAPSIDPGLTLDISIGRSGIRGTVDASKVMVTPEAKAATNRYLARSFTDYVTDRGTKPFDVRKASRWVENNREILDQFPELRNQLGDATAAQDFANQTATRLNARRKALQDPRISTAARFLEAEPGAEIEVVFKSKNPMKMTQSLMSKAAKDGSGEALEGLRGGYIDYVINKSSIGPYDEVGEQTLSGKHMMALIQKNAPVLRRVLGNGKLNRMRRIAQELVKVELAESTPARQANIKLDDMPSTLLSMASRVGGAQFGRWVAKVTGGGTVQTPGIFSERFKIFAKHLTKDRAFQLIHDAITNNDGGELLKTLLLPVDKPKTAWGIRNVKKADARINAWLLGAGNRILVDIEQDVDQQP